MDTVSEGRGERAAKFVARLAELEDPLGALGTGSRLSLLQALHPFMEWNRSVRFSVHKDCRCRHRIRLSQNCDTRLRVAGEI
jgi:hypothetical protein